MKPEIKSSNTKTNRIAKVIARSGLCSRREAERLIISGNVKVNNKILLECGVNVTSKDQIEVNNQPLPSKVITKLWLFNKQRGYLVTNNDPEGRPTIFDQLKENGLLIIEHTKYHSSEHASEMDPFGVKPTVMPYVLTKWFGSQISIEHIKVKKDNMNVDAWLFFVSKNNKNVIELL